MGVSTRVSTRESVMGKMCAFTPSLAEMTLVAAESVLPSASKRERNRLTARSRSPV